MLSYANFIHLPLWLVTVTVDRAEFSESFQKKLEICLFIMVVPQFQPWNERIISLYLFIRVQVLLEKVTEVEMSSTMSS